MKEKRIALLIETSTSWGTGLVKGIADYAHAHDNWSFFVEPRGRYELLQLPGGWTGDGIIARVTHQALADQIIASGKPAVNVSWYDFGSESIPHCTADELQAGPLIAEHFITRGFRQFAYCGPVNRPNYVDLFGQAFQAAIAQAGYECLCFEDNAPGARNSTWESVMAGLGEWVVALPKPIALLVHNDVRCRQLSEACRLNGVKVPEEIALIGGEHDMLSCQMSRPKLSSIDFSAEQVGSQAAAMLAGMMAGDPYPAESIRIPLARIIVRQSTDTLAVDDPLIVQAVRFIIENASRAISVNDVVKAVPTSRRKLEMRFQNTLQRSPASEIRRVRIEHVKQLLVDTDWAMPQIAAKCGFERVEVLTRTFKKQEGITPRAYRNKFRSKE